MCRDKSIKMEWIKLACNAKKIGNMCYLLNIFIKMCEALTILKNRLFNANNKVSLSI